MSLLLAADAVTLYAATGADGHGWATADLSTPLWSGAGSLQTSAGRVSALAGDGGGAGPYSPAHSSSAQLYLPPDAPVADGVIAEVRGEHYALSQSRLVTDPTGSAALDCWAATATGTSTYGGDL